MSGIDEGKVSIVYPELSGRISRKGLIGALGLFGPGAIVASVTIASGETFFASRAGAIFGYSLLWFIVLCVACKLIQVYTAARYMTLSGEHPMEAWARLPGPRGWFPAFVGVLSFVCFPSWIGGLSLMLGTVLNWVLGLDAAGEQQQWLYAQLFATGTVLLAIFLTLVQSYKILETFQKVIVATLLVAILVAVGLAPVDWVEVARGTFLPTVPVYADWMREAYPDVVAKETVLVSLVVFMTAIGGGTYDYIGYLSFFREKRWGALGVKRAQDAAAVTSPNICDTQENLATGKKWLRAPGIDVFIGFACVLLFSLAFNILAAAILHPQKVVPAKIALLTPQVEFLTQFGAGFKYLYQLGIVMAFWGTIYAAFEIYSRTAYECFRPLMKRVRQAPYETMRLPVCLYAGIGGLILLWTMKDPVAIIRPIGPIGTLTCGIWCFAMIWADRKMLPARFQIAKGWVILNVVAGTIMTGLGGMAFWEALAPFFK